MESKPAKKFKGHRAWISWIHQFGPLPEGLENRTEVTILEAPKRGHLKIPVKTTDGRVFSVWVMAVDAGTLYRTEGDPTWRHESARIVIERLRRELTEFKNREFPESLGWVKESSVSRLEWVIARNTQPRSLPFSVCG